MASERLRRFIKTWLDGTTCHRIKHEVHWSSEDGRFVLMKHKGHKEWCGRWTGQMTCETYYSLYDLDNCEYDGYGDKALVRWAGRWSKAKQKELENFIASYS